MATIISTVTGINTVRITVNISAGDVNNWSVLIGSKQDHELGQISFPEYPYYVDKISGSGTYSFIKTYPKQNYVAQVALQGIGSVDFTYFDLNLASPLIDVLDYGFASLTGCTLRCAAVEEKFIRLTAKFQASVACTAHISWAYKRPDGSDEGWTNEITLPVGITELCFPHDVYKYVVGTFTNLNIIVSNIIAV